MSGGRLGKKLMSYKIYNQVLTEAFQNKEFSGKLNSFSMHGQAENLSCGDKIEFFILKNNEIIEKISFTAEGCMLVQASATLLCQAVLGKKWQDLLKMDQIKMLKIVKVKIGPNRQQCVLLPLQALKNAK